MERRLWHQNNHHVKTARCSALELTSWCNLHTSMWFLTVRLKMNVLMRLLRMIIGDSFVKIFLLVQKQLISFFLLFCSSFFNLLSFTIGYLSLNIRSIRSFLLLRLGIERSITLKYIYELDMIEMTDEKIL